MAAKRILIADDHEILRKGLRTILSTQKDWEVVGEADNGREAVRSVKELQPDVVVMDISMPELNGLEAVRQIAKAAPRTRILVLTMHESEELIRETLHAGARGYVLKSDTSARLVPAVEAVLRDEPFFTPKASEVVLRGFLDRGDSPTPTGTGPELTPREREIVQLIAEGKTSKEVAAILNISVKTAETHRTNVMKKLDLHSVSELVLYAVRNHIIEA